MPPTHLNNWQARKRELLDLLNVGFAFRVEHENANLVEKRLALENASTNEPRRRPLARAFDLGERGGNALEDISWRSD